MSDAARPEDVHPEYDHPTPANADEWSDAQLDRYNELKDAELDARARENRVELSVEEEAALEQLGKETGTATVTFESGTEVEVKRHLTAAVEDRLDTISEAETLMAAREDIIAAMANLIEDDAYASERVWRAYAAEYGTSELFERFTTVAEPALERMEELGEMDSFRSE